MTTSPHPPALPPAPPVWTPNPSPSRRSPRQVRNLKSDDLASQTAQKLLAIEKEEDLLDMEDTFGGSARTPYDYGDDDFVDIWGACDSADGSTSLTAHWSTPWGGVGRTS